MNRLRQGALAAKIQRTRVAHLATVGRDARPHVVPVCFVSDGHVFYIPLDRKPKRTAPMKLVRARNIQANPNVALLVDHYEENWDKLWFVLLRGKAALLRPSGSKEHRKAVSLLRKKYPQYAAGFLPDNAPLIRVLPTRVSFWGRR
jgi:PPOX class probable F420-dependent enzyme